MDQITQQNASLVQETNAALQSAQLQVEELRQAVAFFEGDAAASQPVPDEPRPMINPVHRQFQALAREVARQPEQRLASGGNWKEF